MQECKMATGVRRLSTVAGGRKSPFDMKMAKTIAAGTRPRGNDHKRYHHYILCNQHLRPYLDLIITFVLSVSFAFSPGAGRLLSHQTLIQNCDLSSNFCLSEEPFFSKKTDSHFREFGSFLVLYSLAFLAQIRSRPSLALAEGLRGDKKLHHSLILQQPGEVRAQDCIFLYRRIFTRIVISCLAYLALGFLAALIWKSFRIHLEEPSLYYAGAQDIQPLHQSLKKADLRILAAILVAPTSSDHRTLGKKLVNYLFPILNIGDISRMDPQVYNRNGIYRSIRHRMAEDETMTLRDAEARENATSVDLDGKGAMYDVPPPSGRAVTGRHNSELIPSSHLYQARMESRHQKEIDSTANISNVLNAVPSSTHTTSQIQMTSSPIRSAIRKARSGVFRQTSSYEGDEMPPLPNQGFIARAAGSIFRSVPDRGAHVSSVAARSISNPEPGNNSCITEGPTNLRRVRDLGFEEQARALGFDISHSRNRFGLPEETIGDNTVPVESTYEDFSTAGTMAGPAVSDDEHDYTDGESTCFGEVTVSEVALLHTPPPAATIPNTEAEGGLSGLENSQPDNMAWLTDCFSQSNIDLLKDFGTPPRVEANMPHSHSAFDMADETRNGLQNFDAPPTIGDFGAYEADKVQDSEPVRLQPDHDNNRDITKLRGEIRKLVGKYLAKELDLQNSKARELAAQERVKTLEEILDFHGIPFENAEKQLENDDVFDPAVKSHGMHQTPTSTGPASNSKGSYRAESERNLSPHKKSKSQEGGFFKSIIGTTEPSLAAFEKMKEQSLLEVNAHDKDPDLAAKLKVSSRQLPPEAPKPASKEPVPKLMGGASSMLRRLSSIDNLKRKATKGSSSSESKNYCARDVSQNSYSSETKDVSLTSISEESTGGAEHSKKGNRPPTEDRQEFFERNEAQAEQSGEGETLKAQSYVNLNKPLPEINTQGLEKTEDRNNRKKRVFRDLFTRN